MSHPHSRTARTAAAGAAGFVLLVAVALAGCNSRRPTGGGGKDPLPAVSSDDSAIAALDPSADSAKIRTVFQQLDSADGAANRPTLNESERGTLAAFLRLTPVEVNEIGLTTFSPTDAAYVEECLLVRAGVRALKLDDRPPLEKARLAFEWACRMVYVDDRVPWPANPWTTLEAGSGIALSRAYVILAVWQQLGLDGCLVGPPSLKTTVSLTPNLANPQGPPNYAPIRACGVLIDGNVVLFDPTAGTAFATVDGKSALTLALAREKPELAKGFATDEVKTWQPFLSPPLAGLARRMEWLEKKNPAGTGVRLFVDLAAQRTKFGGDMVEPWNPPGDASTATRVLGRYVNEDTAARSSGPPLRVQHRILMLPIKAIPKINLEGRLAEEMLGTFLTQFEELRYTPTTPRDRLLRGEYQEAMDTLVKIKERAEFARERMDHDPAVQKDFDVWAADWQRLASRVLRPAPDDPGGARATRDLQAFRSSKRSLDIERAFVLGSASRPLVAEVSFLIATCVHERAERSRAPEQWRNAAEWWQRFLDASSQAGSPLPGREPHARTLLARCQSFAGK